MIKETLKEIRRIESLDIALGDKPLSLLDIKALRSGIRLSLDLVSKLRWLLIPIFFLIYFGVGFYLSIAVKSNGFTHSLVTLLTILSSGLLAYFALILNMRKEELSSGLLKLDFINPERYPHKCIEYADLIDTPMAYNYNLLVIKEGRDPVGYELRMMAAHSLAVMEKNDKEIAESNEKIKAERSYRSFTERTLEK